VRIDKWLWAARFFKTRALAVKACEMGRVESNGQTAKPSREVKVGDFIKVRNEGGEFEAEVLGLSEMRGPAASAALLARETEASQKRRSALAEARRLMPDTERDRAEGRPSKKDRRDIARVRGRF
jgi:ribosome-associated heat shock protein Hsp15